MKHRLPIAVLAAGAAVLATVFFIWSPARSAARPGAPDRSETSPPSEAITPAAPRPPAPAAADAADDLLAARGPASLSKLAAKTDLKPLEIEKLCNVLRGNGASHHRMMAAEILGTRKDPDGRILAALKEASQGGPPEVAHKALESFAAYATANPSAARDVAGWLLVRASSDPDVETRAVAVGAVGFDQLDAAQQADFARLMSDPSDEVRRAAIERAGATREKKADAARLLLDAFHSERSAGLRARIIERLAAAEPSALDRLKGTSRETDALIERALQAETEPKE